MAATTRTLPRTIAQRIAIGLSCLFLGSSMVYAVGLMQNESMHNAAHDTRHAVGFPCH